MSNTVYLLGAGVNQSIKDWDGLSPPMIRDFFKIALQKEKYRSEHYVGKMQTVYEYIQKFWIAEKIVAAEEELRKSGLSKEEYRVFWILKANQVKQPEMLTPKIHSELDKHKEWIYNEHTERTLRKNLYKILLKSAPEKQLVEIVNSLLKIHRIVAGG